MKRHGKNSTITFSEIEEREGIRLPELSAKEFGTPLPIWYEAIRNTPLNSLAIEDICRALRQNLYHNYLVPLALAVFTDDPMAGTLYDGELAAALTKIEPSFWHSHPKELSSFIINLKRVLGQGGGGNPAAISEFLAKWQPDEKG